MHQPDHSIGDRLAKRLRQMGLSGPAMAAYICNVANSFANGRYEAITYKDNVLTLRATSAVHGQELQMQKLQLVEQIRTKLGWPADKELSIRVTLR